MNLSAQGIMTKPVISVKETSAVKDLVSLLNENEISGVPVADEEGKLVGVISITDLLSANIGDEEFGSPDFHTSPSKDGLAQINNLLSPNAAIEERPVSDLMSRQPITADESTSVGGMSRTLVSNRIHRIVIVRDNRPVGIVSVRDILRSLGNSGS